MKNICSTKNLLLFPLINISRILLQEKQYWFNSSMKTETRLGAQYISIEYRFIKKKNNISLNVEKSTFC